MLAVGVSDKKQGMKVVAVVSEVMTSLFCLVFVENVGERLIVPESMQMYMNQLEDHKYMTELVDKLKCIVAENFL